MTPHDPISPLVSLAGTSAEQHQAAEDAERRTKLTARYVMPLGENRGNGFRCQLGTVVTLPWRCVVMGQPQSGKAPFFALRAAAASFGECVAIVEREAE
jgi:hypothetical protein